MLLAAIKEANILRLGLMCFHRSVYLFFSIKREEDLHTARSCSSLVLDSCNVHFVTGRRQDYHG